MLTTPAIAGFFIGESMEHTPTPWFFSKRYGEICYVSQEDDQSFGMHCPVDMKDEAIIRRIVACVNALAPFTTEQIEQGIDLVELVKQRDKLADDYRAQGLALQAAKSMQAGETERADKAEAQLAAAVGGIHLDMMNAGLAHYPELADELWRVLKHHLATNAALAAVKGE